MSIVDKVSKIVMQECSSDQWIIDNHIVLVVRYAKVLAKKLHADDEIVEIASWLHDIGRYAGSKDDKENHHISGQVEAQRILGSLGYPQDKIDKVKHCIHAHRGSHSIKRETVEAECVASADAMAHFDTIIPLLYSAFVRKKKDVKEGSMWVLGKLERDWGKMVPEAKELVKDKYKAAKLLME